MADIKAFGPILPGISYQDRPGAYGFILNQYRELAVVRTSYGLFLPGGGLDPGEDDLSGLARELNEELGFELVKAIYLYRASQYHWSEHYQAYFRKIGAFYEAQVRIPTGAVCAEGHELVWMPLVHATRELSQEFQRWATEEFKSFIK